MGQAGGFEYIVGAHIVRKLMREARRCSRQIDRGLEAIPSGWSVASYDPNILFDAFPSLRLRDGFQLAAYQYHTGGGGNGFVFAIPLRRWLPDPLEKAFGIDWPSLSPSNLLSAEEHFPVWMHPDVENFLEGDGSTLSYFQASIFVRELREMGAPRRACSWCAHEVLTSGSRIANQSWTWIEPRPRDWRPLVRQDPEGAHQVVFYSHSGFGRESIVLHLDTFYRDYRFNAEEKPVAKGEGGYIF
jgi:hypothetical protein